MSICALTFTYFKINEGQTTSRKWHLGKTESTDEGMSVCLIEDFPRFPTEIFVQLILSESLRNTRSNGVLLVGIWWVVLVLRVSKVSPSSQNSESHFSSRKIFSIFRKRFSFIAAQTFSNCKVSRKLEMIGSNFKNHEKQAQSGLVHFAGYKVPVVAL